MRTTSAARRWLQRMHLEDGICPESPPITNSDYFQHFPQFIESNPTTPLVPCGRVSQRDQHYKRNLDSQIAGLVDAIKANGLPRVTPIREVCSGWRIQERGQLELAASTAKQIGGGILWESVSRALRPFDFKHDDPERAGASLRLAEMELFLSIVGDVPLVTLLHPDTDWRVVRSHEIKRGIEYRRAERTQNNESKRPGYLKARRVALKPKVQRMYELGWDVPSIVAELGVPRRTIYRWI